jgi:hypothetical protein
VAFLVLALVVSPLAGLVVAIGLALAGADIGAVVMLFVFPALATLLVAVRTERPNWVIAVSPVVSGTLGFLAGVMFVVFFTERPFD